MMLKACLNGTRGRAEHPRCPITPAEVARDGAAAVRAGATLLHIHPRREDGRETLDARHVGATLASIRSAVDAPIGVTTGAWLLPDPDERRRAIQQWTELPDFASVNFHEPGAIELSEVLLERGIGVEAGVWVPASADVLMRSGLADRCLRVLLEPIEGNLEGALATVNRIEHRLDGVAPLVPRLLHGCEGTAWPMLDVAAERGYDTRIGLEDTLRTPDGALAIDNSQLVRLAVEQLGLGSAP